MFKVLIANLILRFVVKAAVLAAALAVAWHFLNSSGVLHDLKDLKKHFSTLTTSFEGIEKTIKETKNKDSINNIIESFKKDKDRQDKKYTGGYITGSDGKYYEETKTIENAFFNYYQDENKKERRNDNEKTKD